MLLLRAWADTSTARQYSVLHENGCSTLIPIPEQKTRLRMAPCFLDPYCTLSPCTKKPIADYILGEPFLLHNDPRLDLGFYTGYWAPRGRIPRGLREGDLVLFMAGLVREESLEESRRGLEAVQERGAGGVYVVGGLIVERILDVFREGWEKALKEHYWLQCSPHYWRRGDAPVALIGRGFLLYPPLRASSRNREPSRELASLIGLKKATALARSNYRRSGLLPLDAWKLLEEFKEGGYDLVYEFSQYFFLEPSCRKPG